LRLLGHAILDVDPVVLRESLAAGFEEVFVGVSVVVPPVLPVVLPVVVLPVVVLVVLALVEELSVKNIVTMIPKKNSPNITAKIHNPTFDFD
jgi:hypothetical protein